METNEPSDGSTRATSISLDRDIEAESGVVKTNRLVHVKSGDRLDANRGFLFYREKKVHAGPKSEDTDPEYKPVSVFKLVSLRLSSNVSQ